MCESEINLALMGKKVYTLCLKNVPTFKLSVTLSNLKRFSKFFITLKRKKFATKPI